MAEIESRLFSEEFYAATQTALETLNVEVKPSTVSLVGNDVEIEAQKINMIDQYDYHFSLSHSTYAGDVISPALSEIVSVEIVSTSGEKLAVSLLPCDGAVLISEDIENGVSEDELSLIPSFIISAAKHTHDMMQNTLKDIARVAFREYEKQKDEQAESGRNTVDFQAELEGYDVGDFQRISMYIYEQIGTYYSSIHVWLDEETSVVYELDMEDFELRTWVSDSDITDVTNQMYDVHEYSRLARILLS